MGRLSREVFASVQQALEARAEALGKEQKLPDKGQLRVSRYVAEFEIDPVRRVMTLTGVSERS